MGANCCKVTSDKQHSVVATSARSTRLGSSVAQNSRQITRHHSPSWSFRWDHRTHIEEDIPITGNSSSRFSNSNINNNNNNNNNESVTLSSGNESPEIKLEKPLLEKEETFRNPKLIPRVQSMESNSSSPEIKLSNTKPPSLVPRVVPTATSDIPEASRRTRRSPGYTLCRQVSDSRIPSISTKSSSFNSLSNMSPSHSLSNNSSENNWSMRTFSELVGSASQRDILTSSSSFDSVITKMPLSPDSESCKICSRVFKDRSPFSAQKIYSGKENSVIAVLPCGHAYHADCLENITKEVDKYDPNCPVCTYGDKFVGGKKGFGFRVSRNAVVDLDLDSGLERTGKRNDKGKGVIRSRFNKPFLRRHFSTGTQRPDSERKKGFWGRYRKD